MCCSWLSSCKAAESRKQDRGVYLRLWVKLLEAWTGALS